MRKTTLFAAAAVIAATSFALGAETRKSLVQSYSSLADTILGAKKTEEGLVRVILEQHAARAKRAFGAEKWEDSAAEMALFANEGDNQVGGIRNRLVEGGHHHNAEGEAKGVFDPGFVLVTKEMKQKALGASKDLLEAKDAGGRKTAWEKFEKAASALVQAD